MPPVRELRPNGTRRLAMKRGVVSMTGLLLCLPALPGDGKEIQRPLVQPAERLVVRPVTASWQELLALPSPSPATGARAHVQQDPLELPPIEVAPAADAGIGSGAVAAAGHPCFAPDLPCEPPMTLRIDAQLDVADTSGVVFIPPDVAGGVGPGH